MSETTTQSSPAMKDQGWFALQIAEGDFFADHDYGDPGEWIVLDQGNEIPEPMLHAGPWENADEAIAAADEVIAAVNEAE